MRVMIAMGLTVLLSACGGGTGSATSSTSTTTASTSSNASSAANPVAALTGGVEGGNDCSKNPSFVAIYTGGTVKICSNAHFDAAHKTSGSVAYTTSAAPADVLAWSKEQAAKAGLPERMAAPGMLSVGENGKRTMVVYATANGAETKVTVNWSNPD
jgi:hypothetical protein